MPFASRSLRIRLLSRLALVAVFIMGVTWFLHGMLLTNLARDFLAGRLQQEAEYIISRLALGDMPLAPVERDLWPDTSVFHHVYLVRRGGQVFVSPSEGVRELESFLKGPDRQVLDIEWQGHPLLAWREQAEIRDEMVTVLVGEDFAQVDRGLARLHLWIGATAALISLLLLLLSWVVVQRALRPLAGLKRQLWALRRGERDCLDVSTVSELEDVVAQINEFVDEQRFRQLRSRQSLANLSHAIKTPLAAIIQALGQRKPLTDKRREQILHRLYVIDEKLTEALRRSRIAGQATGQRRLSEDDVDTMLGMMATLYPDIDYRFLPDRLALTRLPLERHDAMEVLGIVLDNGGKWAARSVTVDCVSAYRLVVEDDGPGVPEGQRHRLGERGWRLDEQRPGHGLGLSILRQLVERYRGDVHFGQASGGGLRIELILPSGDS
ncbi:sensor histidine kinase [Salinicola sp. CPA57]|uniref:sensor histidine kinase n=1 Tax=Salinicola sp. CPA57 TaxID=1949080 RepID=UPI000DA123F5|nr:sensor histidine kinase [Salinicola sp. CPA57]